jgi:hypothetical protein
LNRPAFLRKNDIRFNAFEVVDGDRLRYKVRQDVARAFRAFPRKSNFIKL